MNPRRLQNIFDLWVVNSLDFRLILERRFPTDMFVDLEARFVQGVLVLLPTNVVYDHLSSLYRSLVRLWFANITRCRRTTIAGVFVVVEVGDHIVGPGCNQGRLAGLDFAVIA